MNYSSKGFDYKPVSDVLCFSHLRWDFVYQRPQHLMSRFAEQFRVFFIEEPVFHAAADGYDLKEKSRGVLVCTPLLNDQDQSSASVIYRQKKILNKLVSVYNIENFISWYYTPMSLKFSMHLKPDVMVYDCMDELSAFKFAPAELKIMEAELMKNADVVFTGGHSLYQAKKHLHKNIFPFPSSIDKKHFETARHCITSPADQEKIQGKKIGFYGVIDERFDIRLINEVSNLRPDWHFILIGPVVKIDPASLPVRDNIHYLGGKEYKDLPAYLGGWDIAMIPFEKNESTRFISPTKTPEYLAGGKPVISASINDVVSPYGDNGLVYIADTAEEFILAAEKEFAKEKTEYNLWLSEVDGFLKDLSWDNSAGAMLDHIYSLNISAPALFENNAERKSVA